MSKAVKSVYGSRRNKIVSTSKLNKTAKEAAREREKRQRLFTALSYEQRDSFLASGSGDVDMGDWEDVDDAFLLPPPGEEGQFHSHEGDEELFDIIVNGAQGKSRADPRTRKTRVQRMVDAWREQLPILTDAYLRWKLDGPPDVSVDGGWWIDTCTITTRIQQQFLHDANAQSANETLARHGFIGATPERPTLAFSITLFEIFRQIHRVCPRLSIYAMCRALSNIHGITFKNHLAEQFSGAYDCYLAILREVHHRCQVVLHRDSPEWQAQNVCPPCLYRLEDEPKLQHSMLIAMDGNNSLKLVDSTFQAGTVRENNSNIHSFRWLSTDYVDVYKDEVKRTAKTSPKEAAGDTPPSQPSLAAPVADGAPQPHSDVDHGGDTDTDQEVAWLNAYENEEIKDSLNVCVERWKSAGPEARKKMFALFTISGVFVAICRHGHVLLVCDMIRSGELMKYPIALTNALLDRYGPDIGLGYDIMCAFVKTLKNSTIGPRVAAMNLQGIVPAFHGHAHNRMCQVHWHPLYKKGVGLEDLETCERTFHKSNELAAVTRLATPFHRKQEIEEHWNFIDIDKFSASANFIYQNYRQALEKIRIDGSLLAALSVRLKTTNADYERHLDEERKYLKDLQVEPEEYQFAADYLDLLLKLDALHLESMKAEKEFKMLDYNIINNGYKAPQIREVRTRYRTTFTRWEACNTLVCQHEESHGIVERWTPQMQCYIDAQALLSERKYRRALDELERLVVQRLFEMTKLGMSGVGYRMRDKIGRSLKTRSDAIATALRNYNHAASLLNPPRPQLTWASVVQASNVADFDLLRSSRADIISKPWAEASRREATNLYFGIKRAHEEIERLNVEIKRLITFMVDDHIDFFYAVGETVMRDPALAAELSREYERREVIYVQQARRLSQTSQLSGFTGSLEIGIRNGRDSSRDSNDSIPRPSWLYLFQNLQGIRLEPSQQDGDNSDDEIGDVEQDSDIMVQLVETLSA